MATQYFSPPNHFDSLVVSRAQLYSDLHDRSWILTIRVHFHTPSCLWGIQKAEFCMSDGMYALEILMILNPVSCQSD